jgi:hypothetical protein
VPAFLGWQRPSGWPREDGTTRRELAVDRELDLAARQADVSQQVVVQRPQLGDGDPAPALAGIRLEDGSADQSRQAQEVAPERVGDAGAAEGLGDLLAVGRGRVLARLPVRFIRRSTIRRAFVQARCTPSTIASARRWRASAVRTK